MFVSSCSGFLQDLQEEHDVLHEQYKEEAAALEAKYQKLYGKAPVAMVIRVGTCATARRTSIYPIGRKRRTLEVHGSANRSQMLVLNPVL